MDHRRAALENFKEGAVRFLICTDVAARGDIVYGILPQWLSTILFEDHLFSIYAGIDIKGLPFVVNMTLPDESENYIHRIGRVGRAEKLGLAISIVAPTDVKEKVWYHRCGSKGFGNVVFIMMSDLIFYVIFEKMCLHL